MLAERIDREAVIGIGDREDRAVHLFPYKGPDRLKLIGLIIVRARKEDLVPGSGGRALNPFDRHGKDGVRERGDQHGKRPRSLALQRAAEFVELKAQFFSGGQDADPHIGARRTRLVQDAADGRDAASGPLRHITNGDPCAQPPSPYLNWRLLETFPVWIVIITRI